MNKSLLVALCVIVTASANAGNWFTSNSTQTSSTSVATKFAGAKDVCKNFFAGIAKSAKDNVASVGTSLTTANTKVDATIISKFGWFKNHTNVLQASKAVVVTAAVAATCYMLKKAYNVVKAKKA